jgi:large subunit ribosomal protein L10
MPREEKIKKAQEVRQNVGAAITVFADFQGTTVIEFSELRKRLREFNSRCEVIKNNLIERAYEELNLPLDEFLKGPTAVIWGFDDPINCVKVIFSFNKEFKKFQPKGGVFERKVIQAAEIKQLSQLPSREILLAKAVGSMKSPITKLVFVLGGIIPKFVRTLDAIRQKKEISVERGA